MVAAIFFFAVLIWWFRWTRKADVNSTAQTTQPQGRNQTGQQQQQKKNERTNEEKRIELSLIHI